MKILLLEDDFILLEILNEFLQSKGFAVECVMDGEEAQIRLYENKYDMLILDVNVPFMSGFEVLANLRSQQVFTPAIFITSLHTSIDMEMGFKSGGDDYIKKPFELDELLLRMENLKRIYHIQQHIIIDQSVWFDIQKNEIHHHDQIFHIAKKEAEILKYLINNHHKAVNMDELSANLWSFDQIPTQATIRTYIKKIRQFLGEKYISNIKGVGYQFNKI